MSEKKQQEPIILNTMEDVPSREEIFRRLSGGKLDFAKKLIVPNESALKGQAVEQAAAFHWLADKMVVFSAMCGGFDIEDNGIRKKLVLSSSDGATLTYLWEADEEPYDDGYSRAIMAELHDDPTLQITIPFSKREGIELRRMGTEILTVLAESGLPFMAVPEETVHTAVMMAVAHRYINENAVANFRGQPDLDKITLKDFEILAIHHACQLYFNSDQLDESIKSIARAILSKIDSRIDRLRQEKSR